MVKVCHMSSAHQQNDPRIFYKQCTSLSKAGYDTYFVARGENREENGVHLTGISTENTSRLKRMLKTSKEIYKKALEIDADIYEFHDPELLPYALKLKHKGKKVIFDSHEDYPTQIMEKDWIPDWMRNIISTFYKSYETYVVKKLDAVLFPCTKNGVNIFDGRAKETVIISNAVMLSEVSQPDTSVQKSGDTICCTGSLTHQRGITHLIQAAGNANVKLILAGNYSSSEYQKELEQLPQYSCVEYKGYVNREGLADVYRLSSIGMSTLLNVGQYSSLDNFPTKVYEYMAIGLPVIVSDYPFMRKAVEEGNFGICVDPNDINAISKAIKYILSNPELAAEMGENGRKAVIERYNWGIEEKKLLSLYDKLCKN